MEDIRIRYVLKNKYTNELCFKWYSISQIEENGLSSLFPIEDYDIVSRNKFTNAKDINKINIYEGDKIQDHEKIYIIRNNEWESGIVLEGEDGQQHPLSFNISRFRFKIIGNIYKL